MQILPWVLFVLAWPITSGVVNWLRHRPHNLEPGVGTQHIVIGGAVVQVLLLGAGAALLIVG